MSLFLSCFLRLSVISVTQLAGARAFFCSRPCVVVRVLAGAERPKAEKPPPKSRPTALQRSEAESKTPPVEDGQHGWLQLPCTANTLQHRPSCRRVQYPKPLCGSGGGLVEQLATSATDNHHERGRSEGGHVRHGVRKRCCRPHRSQVTKTMFSGASGSLVSFMLAGRKKDTKDTPEASISRAQEHSRATEPCSRSGLR